MAPNSTSQSHSSPIIETRQPQQASPSSVAAHTPQPLDFYAVIDVEATCDKGLPFNSEHEVIELPVVLLNGKTNCVEAEFHAFVRPTENPVISEFCTELTGITQEQTDASDTLPVVMQRLVWWLKQRGLDVNMDGSGASFAFLTDGPWDLNQFLDVECRRKCIPKPACFNSWVNVRWLFSEFYCMPRVNIEGMLEHWGLKPIGRLHCGLDDTRNVARIAHNLARRGCELRVNDGLDESLAVRWMPLFAVDLAKMEAERPHKRPRGTRGRRSNRRNHQNRANNCDKAARVNILAAPRHATAPVS